MAASCDGGQVTAIGDEALNYVKRGRTYAVEMPKPVIDQTQAIAQAHCWLSWRARHLLNGQLFLPRCDRSEWKFSFPSNIYLGAAVIAVPHAARFGLGSVLGYLLAGIAIGPVTGLVGSETKDLQHFAEFGVVMMLFLIGLELEPRVLWNRRQRLLGLGGMQVGLTMLADFWRCYAHGV